MRRSGLAAAALALLFLTAGCLSGAPPTDTASATPTPDPTPGETATAGYTSTERASEIPDADKAVHVENRWNRSVEIRISVVRAATNETVYEATETFEPGADRDVYSLAEADPDGIESFRIVASGLNTTESVTVRTSACYGNAYVEVTEEGELFPYYAIC